MSAKLGSPKTIIRGCAAGLIVAASLAWGQGAVYYVAPDGQDTNPGTREQPFASLERARDVIREQRPVGATVYLRGGRHAVRKTFALTKEIGRASCRERV